MKLKNYLTVLSVIICLGAVRSQASIILDTAGDIDPGITTGGGTLDILSMEVSNSATDIVFTLTLNGNISTTDWGNFLIGISTGNTATTNTGNGWARPIQLNSPIGGMDYWIGSWVSAGGGSQLWDYDGASWTGPLALSGFSFTSGTTSEIIYTASLASLGLSAGDTIYFDAFTSGGGGGDSAVDALSNPNISITSWGQTYTSSTIGSGGVGLSSYTLVPEPSSILLLGLSAILYGACRSRRRK